MKIVKNSCKVQSSQTISQPQVITHTIPHTILMVAKVHKSTDYQCPQIDFLAKFNNIFYVNRILISSQACNAKKNEYILALKKACTYYPRAFKFFEACKNFHRSAPLTPIPGTIREVLCCSKKSKSAHLLTDFTRKQCCLHHAYLSDSDRDWGGWEGSFGSFYTASQTERLNNKIHKYFDPLFSDQSLKMQFIYIVILIPNSG